MGAIVLFDNECQFCDRTVNWLIARDRNAYFKFAAINSDVGRELAVRHGVDPDRVDSVILIEDDKAYVHSTAAIRIARKLPGIWRFAGIFLAVPRRFRDHLYRAFARNRYRFFGRREVCLLPSPEVRARFL